MTNLEIKVTRYHCSGPVRSEHGSRNNTLIRSDSSLSDASNGAGKDVAVLTLKGIGDSLSRDLEPTIKDLRAENIIHYIFDFSEVTTINSTGIGFLLKLVAEAQGRHSQVVVIGASERLKTACDLVGLWGYFTLADNLEHALKMVLKEGNPADRWAGNDMEM